MSWKALILQECSSYIYRILQQWIFSLHAEFFFPLLPTRLSQDLSLRISYNIQELPFYGGVRVAHLFSFLSCLFACLFCFVLFRLVFFFFFFSVFALGLVAQRCLCLWVVYSWLPFRFSLTFIINAICIYIDVNRIYLKTTYINCQYFGIYYSCCSIFCGKVKQR